MKSSPGKLGALLPEYVATRRWYRSKARTIDKIDVEDAFRLPNTRAELLILKIAYADGNHDLYILPVSLAPEGAEQPDEIVATLISESGEQGVLYSALGDDVFRGALLHAISCEASISGQQWCPECFANCRVFRGVRVFSTLKDRQLRFASRTKQHIYHLPRPLHSEALPQAGSGHQSRCRNREISDAARI